MKNDLLVLRSKNIILVACQTITLAHLKRSLTFIRLKGWTDL